MRILVVEDTPINQLMIRMLLEREGHEPKIAASGAEALKSLEGLRFGLALMDLDLPDMTGIDVAKAIRKRETASGQRTPIIALSGSRDANLRRLCLEAGMDGFWVKPFSVEQLNQYIKENVGQPDDARQEPWEENLTGGILDVQKALELSGGDKKLLSEMAGMFLKDIHSYVDEMALALQMEEMAALVQIAHRFKSGAINFGPNKLATALELLERLAMERAEIGSIAAAAGKAREEANKLSTALAQISPGQ